MLLIHRCALIFQATAAGFGTFPTPRGLPRDRRAGLSLAPDKSSQYEVVKAHDWQNNITYVRKQAIAKRCYTDSEDTVRVRKVDRSGYESQPDDHERR